MVRKHILCYFNSLKIFEVCFMVYPGQCSMVLKKMYVYSAASTGVFHVCQLEILVDCVVQNYIFADFLSSSSVGF